MHDIPEKMLKEFRYCSNLMHRTGHNNRRGYNDYDLRGGQGKIMHILDEHKGVTQKELLDILQIRPASLSELISKLEHKGYIFKVTNQSDKRVSDIKLTEEGKNIAKEAKEARHNMSKEVFEILSEEEQIQFLSLLTKINAHLEKKHSSDDFAVRRHGVHGKHERRRHHHHMKVKGDMHGFGLHDSEMLKDKRKRYYAQHSNIDVHRSGLHTPDMYGHYLSSYRSDFCYNDRCKSNGECQYNNFEHGIKNHSNSKNHEVSSNHVSKNEARYNEQCCCESRSHSKRSNYNYGCGDRKNAINRHYQCSHSKDRYGDSDSIYKDS